MRLCEVQEVEIRVMMLHADEYELEDEYEGYGILDDVLTIHGIMILDSAVGIIDFVRHPSGTLIVANHRGTPSKRSHRMTRNVRCETDPIT